MLKSEGKTCIIEEPSHVKQLTPNQVWKIGLKGKCQKIFGFRFSSWIIFPQAPENIFRVISNLFENLQRYLQVKVHCRCQLYWWQICHRYQRHWRQILPPVLLVLLIPIGNNHTDDDTLKWTWKEKIVYMLTPLLKGLPKIIIKTFLIEDFLSPVSTTLMVHLAQRISPKLFKKILNGPIGILRGLGETDS